MLTPVKNSISFCHIKIHTHICLELFWNVFTYISLLIQTRQLFHWRKCYYGLWCFSYKQRFEVKNVLMMDLFLTNMQLFTSQDINWWTGVVWIIVMFLSAVWTLILMAPIHCRASIGEQLMLNFSKSVEETNSFSCWMVWGWVTLHFYFWVNSKVYNHSTQCGFECQIFLIALPLKLGHRFIRVFSNSCFISSWSERETRKTWVVFRSVKNDFFQRSLEYILPLQILLLSLFNIWRLIHCVTCFFFKTISTQKLLVYATNNYKVNTPIVFSVSICSQVGSCDKITFWGCGQIACVV